MPHLTTSGIANVTDSISLDLHAQALSLRELHSDRAYLSSHLVRERDESLEISCRAWPVRQGAQFAKTAFVLDWEQGTIQCPDGAVLRQGCANLVRKTRSFSRDCQLHATRIRLVVDLHNAACAGLW